ncbi:OmpH family outer membrane protein [Merismopedia glauca]|uniref:Uncharacterized protein n=1 Tax=Merismopedia glauca CCAP 1448/3 TaxID=1296344 RepID=A0A2T1C3C4_9CYAN|nr:OmpH family outer membrane protein [Merismopedia glauca]PSB02761.1 hypothetical protein C7B64_11455 [Merismopedia glauca CCAP 1448/3]
MTITAKKPQLRQLRQEKSEEIRQKEKELKAEREALKADKLRQIPELKQKYAKKEREAKGELRDELMVLWQNRLEKAQDIAQKVANRGKLDGATLLAASAVLGLAVVRAGLILARKPLSQDDDRDIDELIETVDRAEAVADSVEARLNPDLLPEIINSVEALENAGIQVYADDSQRLSDGYSGDRVSELLQQLNQKLAEVVEKQKSEELAAHLAAIIPEYSKIPSRSQFITPEGNYDDGELAVTHRKDQRGEWFDEVSLKTGFRAEIHSGGDIRVIDNLSTQQLQRSINALDEEIRIAWQRETEQYESRKRSTEAQFARHLVDYCRRDGKLSHLNFTTATGMTINVKERFDGINLVHYVTFSDPNVGDPFHGKFIVKVHNDDIKLMENTLGDSTLFEQAERLKNCLNRSVSRSQLVV